MTMNQRGQQLTLENGLPSAPEAEKILLGAVQIDNLLMAQLATVLQPDELYSPAHQIIYRAMLKLFERQEPIDPILIGDFLKKQGQLDFIGGVPEIANLTYGLPHFSDLTSYVKLVQEKARLRQLVKFHQRQLNKALNLEESGELIDESITALSKFRSNGNSKRIDQKIAANTLKETVERWAEPNNTDVGIITGIPEFDSRLGMKELAKGDVTLFAGTHGIGKTTILKQMTKLNAKRGKRILYCTFEMPPDRLIKRMLPDIIGIPNKEINPFTVRHNPEKRDKILRGIEIIQNLPIYYEYNCRDEADFRAVVAYYKRFYNVDAVVVDYLQLMTARNEGTRDLELGKVVRTGKESALEWNLPIIFGAQSIKSHGVLKIRDSGNAVKHADNCWFIEEDSDETDGVVQLKITTDKQREGEAFYLNEKTGRIRYEKDFQRYCSPIMTQDENDAGGFEACCERILREGVL